MQVKKFEAPTMNEALNLVKAELGPEAIILSTKNNRKGFGLLSKASVEVTAAVSDKALNKKHVTERLVPSATRDAIDKMPAAKQSEIYDDFTGYVRRRKDDQARGASDERAAQQKRSLDARASGQQQALREPDRSGMGALMGGAQNEARRPSSGGGAFAAANARAPKGNAKAASAPRYVDITDDEAPAAGKGAAYARNGRPAGGETARRAPESRAPESRAAENRAAESRALEARAPNSPESYNSREARFVAAGYDAGEEFQPEAGQSQAGQGQGQGQIDSLQFEIQKLKSMLEEIKTEQTTLTDSRIPEATSDEVQGEYNNLLRNGIDKRYATPLVKQVAFALPRESLKSSDKIIEALAVEMMSNIKVEHPIELKPGSGCRVFALVGPTGVGKTTTIAKLASQAILQRNLRVGLINVDSYKVAALDQLATYAKILNVPFRQASNAAELDRALTEFKPLDLVLIDTSGRSQRDSDSLAQMRQLLADCPAARPLLIMSATTRDQELYDIITRFKIFNPTGLVFSKLDETSTFGCIYNVAVKTGLPLTYFTVGQRVPEDIEPASRERVADLILDL